MILLHMVFSTAEAQRECWPAQHAAVITCFLGEFFTVKSIYFLSMQVH